MKRLVDFGLLLLFTGLSPIPFAICGVLTFGVTAFLIGLLGDALSGGRFAWLGAFIMKGGLVAGGFLGLGAIALVTQNFFSYLAKRRQITSVVPIRVAAFAAAGIASLLLFAVWNYRSVMKDPADFFTSPWPLVGMAFCWFVAGGGAVSGLADRDKTAATGASTPVAPIAGDEKVEAEPRDEQHSLACTKCGAEVLPVIARLTGGMCMECSNAQRAQRPSG